MFRHEMWQSSEPKKLQIFHMEDENEIELSWMEIK